MRLAPVFSLGAVALCLAFGPSASVCAASPESVEHQSPGSADAAYESAIADWRQRRHQRLASPDGWLTLVGLEWLHEGENTVGSGDHADIRIPGGPAEWGRIFLQGSDLRFVPSVPGQLIIDGGPAAPTALLVDSSGSPTIVGSGTLSFHVIERASYALRIKDSRAPTLLAFGGVDNYPINADWRVDGRFLPAAADETIEIANVLGQIERLPVAGIVEFERDGRNHRLLGLGQKDSDALWFLFADRTTGRETYGAGRYLYSDGEPRNGRLILDFNKAYNPPCAFTDYATCPLPPAQNRLDLAVTAGEKKYAHH